MFLRNQTNWLCFVLKLSLFIIFSDRIGPAVCGPHAARVFETVTLKHNYFADSTNACTLPFKITRNSVFDFYDSYFLKIGFF